MMHEAILLSFQKNMRQVRELAGCQKVLTQCLAELKIHVYAFTYYAYHPSTSSKLKYDIAADFLLAWHKHYVEQGYDRIDSTLSTSKNRTLPIIWTLKEQLENAQSALERQMRQDSIDYGVERGISVPVYGPNGDFSELVVQQRFGEKCLEDSIHLQYVLLNIAHIFYNTVSKLLLKEIKPGNGYYLSRRELQCLTLVAQQKSVADIAKALSITERTVNFHIQRANKKLGTKNKYQSVSKALSESLLKI